MLRKRLIGIITVRNGWAVQSIGYSRYLPVGKPECLAENLDRWGVDEIFLQVIDRSKDGLGPDFDVINRVARARISTPLVYGGGIRVSADAVDVIRAGADRVAVDQLLHTHPHEIRSITDRLGAQAVIGSFPLVVQTDGSLLWYDYLSKKAKAMSEEVEVLIAEGMISEALLIDCRNEGLPGAFDFRVVQLFAKQNLSIILFGGLNEADMVEKALLQPQVSAVGIGNFLNYQEQAVQKLKSKLGITPLRPPFYNTRILV